MTRKPWTGPELVRLETLYPNTPMHHMEVIFQRKQGAIYSKANQLGIKRSAAYLASPASGRMRAGSNLGGNTRFAKGQTPWNTGKKGWQAGGRAAETQFKAGEKPHTWRPIGHERVTKDGYLERKMTDTGVTRHDFVAVHRLEWEKHHGPIPPGHVVVFKDNSPKHTGITIDRLELITRADLARRNTIHRYPPELKHAIRKLAKLKRKVQEKQREESNGSH